MSELTDRFPRGLRDANDIRRFFAFLLAMDGIVVVDPGAPFWCLCRGRTPKEAKERDRLMKQALQICTDHNLELREFALEAEQWFDLFAVGELVHAANAAINHLTACVEGKIVTDRIPRSSKLLPALREALHKIARPRMAKT